jgi:hypothetical protein
MAAAWCWDEWCQQAVTAAASWPAQSSHEGIASIQPDCISVEIDLGSHEGIASIQHEPSALALFFVFVLFI